MGLSVLPLACGLSLIPHQLTLPSEPLVSSESAASAGAFGSSLLNRRRSRVKTALLAEQLRRLSCQKRNRLIGGRRRREKPASLRRWG